jgi:hypothetical protein
VLFVPAFDLNGGRPLMLLLSPSESLPAFPGSTVEASAVASFSFSRASLLGFCSLQRLRCREPVSPRDSNPGTFRSQGYYLLSGLLLPILPGLFHPGTLLGFSLQSFLLQEIRAPLGALSPLAVPASPIHGKAPVSTARAEDSGASQLQGFYPSWNSFSCRRGLVDARADALLGFSLQGFLSLGGALPLQERSSCKVNQAPL